LGSAAVGTLRIRQLTLKEAKSVGESGAAGTLAAAGAPKDWSVGRRRRSRIISLSVNRPTPTAGPRINRDLHSSSPGPSPRCTASTG